MLITIKGIDHEIIEENGIKYYKYHFCECPCHTRIKCERSHKYRGIPKTLRNHNWFGKHHKQSSKDKIGKALKNKPKSESHKKKIGDIHRGKIVSKESRDKHAESVRGFKNNMFGIPPSPLCNKHYGSWYYTPLQGYKFLRSTWELAYAEYLDQHNIKWYYESITFPLSDEMTYTPDFYLPLQNKFIEVKGRNNYEQWNKDDNSLIKYNKFKNEYSYHTKIIFGEDLHYLKINLKYYQKKIIKKLEIKEELYEHILKNIFEAI